MAYVVGAFLIALCLYLVIQPFFASQKGWQAGSLKDDLDTITLEQIYATLNELDMEYNMGKVPENEYDKLKSQYEKMAVTLLKEEAYAEVEHKGKKGPHQTEATYDLEITKELEELQTQRKGE
ncbi:hypothetical protein HXZ66_00155 [Bacillus sp. A116_S68]|nr:hypothetical protein HXZ66_00155 [Bacillus sp. A116_S68]